MTMINRYFSKNLLLAFFLLMLLGACTGDFMETNTDPNAATEEELGYDNLGLGSMITQMEYQIFPCITKDQNADVNNYQKMFCLAGDMYSGHQGASNMFDSNGYNNMTYYMLSDWYSAAYTVAYQNYMTPWYSLYTKREISPSAFAIGQILKVFGMHRITDMYGPVPYKDFAPASDVPFTSQQDIYAQFFDELDEAVQILKKFVEDNPGAKPLADYDKIYGGDFEKWIKFANSLKLRLALRIVYVDGETARIKAEEAIADGVFTDNEDNAMLSVDGSATVNPLYMICYTYNDSRLGATMECYLKGYDDPRLAIWFAKSEVSEYKEYNGIRCGSTFNGNDYKVFSNLNVSAGTPIQFMTAAEVYFLRAEAALRGWNAGADEQTLYETGITTAFSQPLGATQSKAGDASAYIEGTSLPVEFEDPMTRSFSYSYTGQVSVRWEDAVGFDDKLEKIITQKWIALFPDGQEAWSEFRRTGCPRVIPTASNWSSGVIDTQKQIARLPYPTNLSKDYPDLYNEAINNPDLLNGGDNGGTKLWWDKRSDKPYQSGR
jgi:hypothetical protein